MEYLQKEIVVDIINKQRDIMINCLMTPEEIKDIYHSKSRSNRIK